VRLFRPASCRALGAPERAKSLCSCAVRDDCSFVDPNNAVTGLAKYRKALSFLFDPQQSDVYDVSGRVTTNGIEVDYVATGVLKLPWHPRIAPWSGHITYTLDADGLISSQNDVWNITRVDALRQTLTPG
jgi:hypothetical protein